MLNNKWRKLKIKENNNNSLKDEDKNDEEEKKEIIIVNMDNISESDIEKEENEEIEKEEEEIEEKENKNETKSEKNFKNTNSKYLKVKPKPIINVDPSAVRITNYIVDNRTKLNCYNNDNYNIQNIINKYNPKMPNNYKNENINNDKKTYQINETSIIDEIKKKYQIKNKKENILSNNANTLNKYIPGSYSYRNNPPNKLNNTYTYHSKKNKANPLIGNNFRNQKSYYNYGPIYNYERTKEIKNHIISSTIPIKENNKENSERNINILSQYNSESRKTYYYSTMDNKNNSNPTKIINNQNFEIKSDIRKDYPNLYYFNDYKNNIGKIHKINNNSKTIQDKINKSRNEKISIIPRRNYSVERPNKLKKNEQIRRATFNLEKKLEMGYLDNSINNSKNNSIKNNRRNNSMIENNKNINEYNNSYSNSFLLNNYIKNGNSPRFSYEINNIDNLYQYYPSYNKSNGFSGNSSFAKLNYEYK